MTKYLTTGDLVAIAHLAAGEKALIRDVGLIDSAAHRPMATAFGDEAYRDLHTKAAALLHSILRNHPLVDGNKRMGWAACRTFLALNGADFVPDVDEATEFVVTVAGGDEDDLEKIADVLREWTS
ncbi:type II toxin-antitoxin system death-on-curing family toxin [Amycolatopsis cynarae]|uniref:Type II toxin-antitoxin system death-on-curing family toxin n=1 Tax=Amycolatopsis cynarae TaxID=2995223 RepID=A0ABY7B0K8_9PSEU|nr:type II toxin-antitoxin system death-on-curing family toxin [Amycolatopsis sp. HUAS 11-8]WAL65504.1 type II toxin-antitoxin system death-on-curing family toxin [Amycolatopsis sp. HUAS 11-8]